MQPTRQQLLHIQKHDTFDCVIIGGGASGLGCALDAALRGYKVALVEAGDFAQGTSSKSTKLIHGGVRYLEQAFRKLDFAQLNQVRHGLQERHILLRNAPHLARPLALLTPVFSWWQGVYYHLGLVIYRWFASQRDTLPTSRWLSRQETLERLPGLHSRTHSAILYYDGQLDDARYCLALAQTALHKGAAIANYVSVTGFGFAANGRIESVLAKDEITQATHTIRTRAVINCTGVFSDGLRQTANPALPARIRPSKGVHITLPMHLTGGHDALLIPKTSDGRVVFAVPFKDKLLVGTTDDPYSSLDKEPQLSATERDYLLRTLQPYLAGQVSASEVSAGFGGLRPLLAGNPGKGTKSLLRDHEVEYDPQSGLISLLGGKWTTYRLMAKDAVDVLAQRIFGESKPSTTADMPLWGNEGQHITPQQLVASSGFSASVCSHLYNNYGDRAPLVIDTVLERPEWAVPLHPAYPFLVGEAAYAARHEMAINLRDFMARRTRLEILDWQATIQALPAAATAMAHVLEWDAAETKRQIVNYQQLLESFARLAQ